MKKTLLFCTAVLISISLLHGQTVTASRIDSLVQAALQTSPSVGMAIAVVKDGKVIHSKGYGLRSVETGKKVDNNTLFAIASNSKAFTSTALAILVDEGKLSWQDKVVDIIPEFRMYDDYVTMNFTIEDLLTHRSGLGLGAGDLMWFPDGADFTIDDILKSFQYQETASPFRTKYDYDNLLYLVAGEVVHRVSGQSWGDFVQTRIFKPLGMDHSVTHNTRIPEKANLALPHRSYQGEIVQLQTYEAGNLSGAAAGIYACVEDLSKWMLLQLNEGRYGKDLSDTLFTERRQREMWRPITPTGFTVFPDPRTQTHYTGYGLGWGVLDKKGKIVVQHTGGMPGMLSRTILVPELELGIVFLTNSDPGGYAFYSIPETILDYYLEIEERDWISAYASRAAARELESDSVLTAAWQVVESHTNVTYDQGDFMGTYRDPWFGEVEISLKDGKLWFTSRRSPKLNGQMFYYKGTSFVVKWEYTDMPCDAFCTFHFDEEEVAQSIDMKGISPNIDFSFDFHDLRLERVVD